MACEGGYRACDSKVRGRVRGIILLGKQASLIQSKIRRAEGLRYLHVMNVGLGSGLGLGLGLGLGGKTLHTTSHSTYA